MVFYILLKILLIIILLLTIFLYATNRLPFNIDGFDNNINDCPDLLIQNGEQFYLYNSKSPTIKGVNPKVFNKLSDYANFVNEHPSCPVLFLQKGYDTQGNDVYNVRGGNPMNSWKYNGINESPPLADGIIRKVFNNQPVRTAPLVDATLQNPPFNQYNKSGYSAFDPYGFDVGRFTPLDLIHISEEILPVSDSASDPNWGGAKHTEQQINGGKYIGNEVYRPIFANNPIHQ